MFGIDDLDLGSLADIIGLTGDVAGAGTGLVDAAAMGGGAALDTANTAFTGASALPDGLDTAGVLSRGTEASAVAAPGVSAPYPDQPSEFYQQPNSANPNEQVSAGGAGKSGTLGDNSYEQPSNQVPNDAARSAGGAPFAPAPAQSFREAAGALPGKWYDAFQKAPADITSYLGDHPFRSAIGAGSAALSLYNASKSAPSNDFAPTPGRVAPAPKVPDQSPGGSPLLSGGTPTSRGRGGMNVRGI